MQSNIDLHEKHTFAFILETRVDGVQISISKLKLKLNKSICESTKPICFFLWIKMNWWYRVRWQEYHNIYAEVGI
jgi:hypothetical protein